MMQTPELNNALVMARNSAPRQVISQGDKRSNVIRKARGVSGNSQKYPRYNGVQN